jgi:lysozyme family protein
MNNTEFDSAFALVMLSEVGSWFNPTDPATQQGLIDTPAHRKAVGYVNNPADPGGETKFGIAQKANPQVSIKTLTLEQAKNIYYNGYWLSGHCDKIATPLSAIHFDTVVNSGMMQAIKFLQTALGLTADGIWGPATMNAATSCADPKSACAKYLDARQNFFDRLVVIEPQLAVFKKGWDARITMLHTWLSKQP